MRKIFVTVTATLWMLTIGGCAAAEVVTERSREPVVGLPCEGCDAIFEGLPDSLSWRERIGTEGEPGPSMRIEGLVTDADGRPTPGVIIYAYHTDTLGIYPRDSRLQGTSAYRHGRLRGWARTDAEGRYHFDTIRPGGYPNTSIPAHVHMHVLEIGRCTYYIDDILFDDDPRLTERNRSQMLRGRGGNGLAVPRRAEDGAWVVRRDIVLGANVPGYPE